MTGCNDTLLAFAVGIFDNIGTAGACDAGVRKPACLAETVIQL